MNAPKEPLPPAVGGELLAAAQRGEEAALAQVIGLYQNRVAAYILTITGEEASVDDLAQTSFVRMARHLSRLRSLDSFEPWLFRIARNACLSHLRRRKITRLFEAFSLRDHDRPVAAASPGDEGQVGTLAWLREALLRLPPAQRELLGLIQEQELSYEELAHITGSSVSAVKSRLFRAREQLRRWRKNEIATA